MKTMNLEELLDLTDYMTDVELLVEVRIADRITTALLAKGTAGEIYMSGLYDNSTVDFITHDVDGVMQIIVK
jgi:hypothetical protein